jgi:hypothetical protein
VGNDPVRAEYIRLACEPKPSRTKKCRKWSMTGCEDRSLQDFDGFCGPCKEFFIAQTAYKTKGFQLQSIYDSYSEQWKTQSGLGGTISHDPGNEESLYRCVWNNGFVEGVVCNGTWQDFLQDCRVIFRHHPVRKFSIEGVAPHRARGNDFDYWFSDQFIEDGEDLGQPLEGGWIPWEVAKHFPTANRIEPGYGGRYGIPTFTRHYWTFANTPNSASIFLSNQLCRYGFAKAWEDRPCSTG